MNEDEQQARKLELIKIFLDEWGYDEKVYSMTLLTDDIAHELATQSVGEEVDTDFIVNNEYYKHVARNFSLNRVKKSCEYGFGDSQWDIVSAGINLAIEEIPDYEGQKREYFKLQEQMCDCNDDCPNSEQQRISSTLVQDICLLCDGRIGEPFVPKYIEGDTT